MCLRRKLACSSLLSSWYVFPILPSSKLACSNTKITCSPPSCAFDDVASASRNPSPAGAGTSFGSRAAAMPSFVDVLSVRGSGFYQNSPFRTLGTDPMRYRSKPVVNLNKPSMKCESVLEDGEKDAKQHTHIYDCKEKTPNITRRSRSFPTCLAPVQLCREGPAQQLRWILKQFRCHLGARTARGTVSSHLESHGMNTYKLHALNKRHYPPSTCCPYSTQCKRYKCTQGMPGASAAAVQCVLASDPS